MHKSSRKVFDAMIENVSDPFRRTTPADNQELDRKVALNGTRICKHLKNKGALWITEPLRLDKCCFPIFSNNFS